MNPMTDRHGKEIPVRGCTAQVACGDGAVMTIVNPYTEDSVEWGLRYGSADRMRYVAASLISSYDYLLSNEITAKEAIRRLRLMRARRIELREQVLAGDVNVS
jgi:hypothetical protein